MQVKRGVFKIIIITIILISVIMFVPFNDGEYIWNPFDYAKITEVDYKAIVVDEPESNGKVIVTERLTFDVNAFSKDNLFWELWRDLGEDYIDGVKVEYKVNSVKQIFDDGREAVVFTESPKLYWDDDDFVNTSRGLGPGKWYHSKGPYNENRRQYECVFFYVDGLYRETVVFEIEYEMYNAALRWADSSELYIPFFSEGDINHLTSFKGQILFPEEKMPRAGNYYANTYGTNSGNFPFTESADINSGYYTFSFELNKSQLKFKKYNEYIEFALVAFGEDRHIFTQHASKNIYYDDNALDELKQEHAEYEAIPVKFKTIKVNILIFSLISNILILALIFAVDKKVKNKYIFYKSKEQMEYFKDIPSELDPNFASALVFCKQKSKQDIQDGYSSVILSLARKGYIELEKANNSGGWNFENIKIIVKRRLQPIQVQPEVYLNEALGINEYDIAEDIFQEEEIADNLILKEHGMLIDSWKPESEQEKEKEPEADISNIEPLTLIEEHYFNLICRHSNEIGIWMSSFQEKVSEDYQYTNAFVQNIKNAIVTIGVSEGYFQKADYKKIKNQAKDWSFILLIIGILFITAGNLISYQTRLDLAFGAFFISGIGLIANSIILNKLFEKCVLLTQFGEDEYAKWRGLYNFLSSETLINESTIVELALWEKYLIYATAFGISEKVIKALRIKCHDADNSRILRVNSYYRTRSFYACRGRYTFKSATRSALYTARVGSYSGYGGGGRGGGGGGH